MKAVAVVMFMTGLALSLASGVSAQAEGDALRRWDESVDVLVRRVSPSVVQIMVTGYGAVSEGTHGNADVVIGRQKAIGSGFVIDAGGYIVTNANVVNGAQRVQVALPGGPADGSIAGSLAARITVIPARIIGVA